MTEATQTLAGVDPNHLDGVAVLRVLLEQETGLEIYPRQIVIVRDIGEEEFIYSHGVPDTTALTAATTVQHKRMRRALIRRSGVRIPDGGTFPVGVGIPRSKRFAERLGYPVVLKPAVGDPGTFWFTDITNEEELDAAIAAVKTPVDKREGIFHSGYTPLVLGQPGSEDGEPTVPRNYRYLIEKRMTGVLVRFLVNQGVILSALECEGSPTDGSFRGGKEILPEVHAELRGKVLDAYQAIPDLAVAAIDVVVSDPSAPLFGQNWAVVDYFERPFLWVHAATNSAAALDLAERIVRAHFAESGFAVKKAPARISRTLKLYGIGPLPDLERRIAASAAEFGIETTEVSWDSSSAMVDLTAVASSLDIAAFLDAATNGHLNAEFSVQMAYVLKPPAQGD